MHIQDRAAVIDTAVKQFPAEFGLRAFPGERFRVSPTSSYINDSGIVMVYTEVQKGDKWLSFAKGTVSELKMEVVA